MTPVGVFFICQNEDKCHFVNSTQMSQVCDISIFGACRRYFRSRKTEKVEPFPTSDATLI